MAAMESGGKSQNIGSFQARSPFTVKAAASDGANAKVTSELPQDHLNYTPKTLEAN